MKIISVNVSLPKEVTLGSETRRSGIFKEPVGGKVGVGRLKLEGDGQGNLSVHGGVDKAVYAYPHEHYTYWHQDIGTRFPAGQFGENLTTEGLNEDTISIGDTYRFGTALLQVSEPREPCSTLAFKMQDLTFPKRFLRSRRVGFYLRVLETGQVEAGDAIELVDKGPPEVSIHRLVGLAYFKSGDLATASAAAQLEALPLTWRQEIQKQLDRMQAATGVESA